MKIHKHQSFAHHLKLVSKEIARDLNKFVNTPNYHTSNLFKFLDHYLQPHVPFYVEDTPDFIKKAKDTRNAILIPIDVKSLYTNIPNHKVMKQSKKYFFYCYLAIPWATLDHFRGGSLTKLMLIMFSTQGLLGAL